MREMTPTEAARSLPTAKSVSVSRNSVCRCLFGRPSSDVSVLQANLDDASRRRWNFDFAAMQPLPAGRFEWTASCSSGMLPSPASRSINDPLAVAADSPGCQTDSRVSSATDIQPTTNNDFQFSSANCRLPEPLSPPSPIPLADTGYIAML